MWGLKERKTWSQESREGIREGLGRGTRIIELGG